MRRLSVRQSLSQSMLSPCACCKRSPNNKSTTSCTLAAGKRESEAQRALTLALALASFDRSRLDDVHTRTTRRYHNTCRHQDWHVTGHSRDVSDRWRRTGPATSPALACACHAVSVGDAAHARWDAAHGCRGKETRHSHQQPLAYSLVSCLIAPHTTAAVVIGSRRLLAQAILGQSAIMTTSERVSSRDANSRHPVSLVAQSTANRVWQSRASGRAAAKPIGS